jgi:phosphatidate cytidylyltransferase
MESNVKKTRPKWVHWLARIGTTFGLAGITWLYLSWADLLGGVFLLGLLCALTSNEYSRTSHPNLSKLRQWMLTIVSFFVPYLFHRILQSAALPVITIRLYEFFLVLFLVTILSAIVFPAVLRVICRSLLFPIWGIALPLTSLIFIANFFISIGRTSIEALLWIIVLIFITKATDIGALLVGSAIGKNKLAPKTSPGKTIEGAIGGVVVAILVGLTLYWIGHIKLHSPNSLPADYNIPKVIISVGIISVFGILGDLFESSWKRFYQKKDSGQCLPGLGGIYDLTDSIILSSPVSYFLVKYFIFS